MSPLFIGRVLHMDRSEALKGHMEQFGQARIATQLTIIGDYSKLPHTFGIIIIHELGILSDQPVLDAMTGSFGHCLNDEL